MSKYIDLADQIISEATPSSPELRIGIGTVLSWLDTHPDQVPGRTMTRGDYNEWLEHVESLNVSNRGAVNMTLRMLGVSVPDPEPTNLESISKLLTEFAELNASCGGEQGDHDLAEFLDARGVKAGGDDD